MTPLEDLLVTEEIGLVLFILDRRALLRWWHQFGLEQLKTVPLPGPDETLTVQQPTEEHPMLRHDIPWRDYTRYTPE